VIVSTTGPFTPFSAKALLKLLHRASGENDVVTSADLIKMSLCALVLLSSTLS
jgi:hypothetical protein